MLKQYKNGLLIGKFMPLHKGHELAIQFGINMCETMNVLVSGKAKDNPSPAYRALGIMNTFDKESRAKTLRVSWDFNIIAEPTYDDKGVGIESWFWRDWVTKIHNAFGDIDAVFTSDPYGEKLAQELNADWLPIDRERSSIPISATAIRNDPGLNWKYVSTEAKEALQKRVAIIGPESTGKTTLTKYLADYFNAGYVPEYGRTMSEIRQNKLTEKDFLAILQGQTTLLKANDNYLIFADTEAYTTKLFADVYLSKQSDALKNELYNHSKFDLHNFDFYIVLAPTVSWVDDGERVLPAQLDRSNFFMHLIENLNYNNKKYKVIDERSFETRNYQARWAVHDLIKDL